MGLLSVAFLITLGLLLSGESIKSKPKFLEDMITKLRPHTENIGLWGVAYGLLAVILTSFSSLLQFDFFARLLGNILIVLMALPLALEKLVAMFPNLNPVVLEEIRGMVGKIKSHGTTLGFTGLGFAALIFLQVFS